MANDLLNILSASTLARLRAGFKLEDMITGAKHALIDPFAIAAPLANWGLDTFFTVPRSAKMSARDRERSIIAMLATADPSTLAIHVYWGLVCDGDPLSVEEVCETVLLAANYRGVDVWNAGAKTISTTLTALQKLGEETTTPLTAQQALGAIGAAFA